MSAERSGSQARDCDWRPRRADGRGDRWGASVSIDPRCGRHDDCPRFRTEDLHRDVARRLPLRHDGLAAKVQEMLGLDPFSGAAFVFRSKRANRLRILVWDRTA
ncbi:IS66 family insertion sequence element accessory protein TnpB [Bradyrhizobium sp. USDA 3256]